MKGRYANNIIRRISNNVFKENKKRNTVTILAIILTTVLFTSLFTVVTEIGEAFKQQKIRTLGADGHVSLKYIDDDVYEQIRDDDQVEKISYGVVIADLISNPELKGTAIEMWYMDKVGLEMYGCLPDEGTYPQKENEIMIDTNTLQKLGCDAKIGNHIVLDYIVKGETVKKEFVLSGYYDADPLLDVGRIFVSEKYYNMNKNILKNTYKADKNITGTVNCNLFFKSSKDLTHQLSKLLGKYGYCWAENGTEKNANYVQASVSPAYTSNSILENPEILFSLVIGILFLVLTGYLVIYNIFQIAVLQDIHFYGQLGTLGATQKQIKKLVKNQARILGLIGIPIGLVFGFVFGKMLAPWVLKSTSIRTGGNRTDSFSVIIFLASAIFSILTIMISTRKPAKLASQMTAIESIKIADVSRKSVKIKPRKNGGKIHKMALYNIGRNKKRTILSVLSMSLAVVIFSVVTVFVNSLDVNKYLSTQISSDFTLATDSYFNGNYMTNVSALPKEYIDLIESQKGVQRGGKIYFTQPLDQNGKFLEGFSFLSEKLTNKGYSLYTDGNILTNVYGIDEFQMSKLKILDGELDIEKFKTGKYILQGIYGEDDLENTKDIKAGDNIVLYHYDENKGVYEKYEYTLMAKVKADNSNTARSASGMVFYMPSIAYNNVVNDSSVMSYAFDCEDEFENDLASFITKTITQASDIGMESKQQLVQEFQSTITSIIVVGIALSVLIGLIGVVNFINSIITSVISREKELAMLQSIGMTDRQVKNMLLFESIYYIVGTIFLSGLLSTILSGVMLMPIMKKLEWFTFNFTIWPVLCVYGILILIAILLPTVLSKHLSKKVVVEILRNNG